MMKKAMIVMALMAAVGLVAGMSWAGPRGWGSGGGHHNGYGGCWQNSPGYYDGAPQNQKYFQDTAELRNQLAAKRGEYHALMQNENPDPQQAGKLQREMAQLRDQLRSKAHEYGVEPRNGRHHGRGWGGSWARRGGPCW